MKKCLRCKTKITGHPNRKRCPPCVKELLKRPQTSMTSEQILEAKSMIGKMSREDIAQALGVSVVSLKRAFRGTRLAFFNKYVVNPGLVKQVCRHYEKHGIEATKKAFPDVCVRSIVERYKYFSPRQIRWTEEQYVQLARFGGLVSFSDQAKYFNRPGANEGSIKSAWMKKFKISGGSINGMSNWQAKYLVTDECPRVITKFWETRKRSNKYARKICLWVDMEKHLRPEIPKFMSDAIFALANFQRWLFETKNPKPEILRIIKMGKL